MSFLTRYDDDPSRPRFRSAVRDLLIRALVPAVGLWLIVVGFGLLLVDGPLQGLSRSEEQVNDALAADRTPAWNTVTEWWSLIGSTPVIIGVCVVVGAALWAVTRKWWVSVIPLLAIWMQSMVFVTSALVVGRDRPTVDKLDSSPPTTSYPSGHESATTALYVAFLLLALRIRHPVLRWTVVVVCAVMPGLVFFARLYRGMHHVTDVGAGVVNGLVCALLAWHYLRRDTPAAEPAAEAQTRA